MAALKLALQGAEFAEAELKRKIIHLENTLSSERRDAAEGRERREHEKSRLSDAELVALAATVFAEHTQMTEARQRLLVELRLRGLLSPSAANAQTLAEIKEKLTVFTPTEVKS